MRSGSAGVHGILQRMISRYEHAGLTWVDLESPSPEEVRSIAEEFAIAGAIADELLIPSAKPRAEFLPQYIYLVLHFPALRHSHKTREQEIDFIIGQNFLITTRYDVVDPLHKFSKVFEVHSILDQEDVGAHAGFLFYFMMRKLYHAIEHEIEFVRHELAQIEERIFSGNEVQMVGSISSTARDLLNLRQTIEPHREILHSLEENGKRFFGEEFSPYLRSIQDEYYRVHNHIMRHTEFLHELRETNNSLLTTKQNETMKRFSILAFATFPLTLIAAIFAMDTRDMPIVGMPHDFWIILGGMAVFIIAVFSFFKYRNWL